MFVVNTLYVVKYRNIVYDVRVKQYYYRIKKKIAT